MQESPIELHQFSHSHFNEKVRWTLDYKSVPHVRICYLPGPHVAFMRRMTGQNETPVLRIDGLTVNGSARIIDLVEQRYPTPSLYPAAAAAKSEALALQARFDGELGPELRRAVFATSIHDAAWAVATFGSEKAKWKQSLYQTAFPLIRLVMLKSMDITPETGRRSKEIVDRVLDFIADRVAATGYLVGDSFTVADLTAAALLAPALLVDHPDMRQAEPRPRRYVELCAGWAPHPAVQWAREMYRRHRPPPCGVVIE